MDNSKHAEETDLERAIGFNRSLLQLVGLWNSNYDYNVSKMLSNIRLIMALSTIILFCLLPGLFALEKVWGNLALIIDNLNYTLSVCAAVIKLLILWSKRKDLAVMNDMIVTDWLRTKSENEINVMKKWAQISRKVSIGSVSLMTTTAAMIVIFPWMGFSIRVKTDIVDLDDRLAMQSYFFYNMSRKSHFMFTYCMQIFGLCSTGISYSGIDIYLALLVFHICGQLQNLNVLLTNLNGLKNFRFTIYYCIQEHIRLLRFIENFDNCFTMMLLMVVIYLTILFCLQGFTVITEINGGNLSIGRTFIIVGAIFITIGHFCVFCVVGEMLVTQSELIYHTTYEFLWYELKPQDARCLILIMMRASKPVYLTAGKFFPITMSTFCSLLKTSGGYISVLLATQS